LYQNIPGPQLRAEIPAFTGCHYVSPSLIMQSAEKTCLNYSEMDILRALNKYSSGNVVSLSQISVMSPMGIRQDIVSFDHDMDDDDIFVQFPVDEEEEQCPTKHSSYYYQKIMPRCQELIQLCSDGAENTAKQFILFLDEAICKAKEEIQKEKQINFQKGNFISVCLPSNKRKKTHGTKHYAKK